MLDGPHRLVLRSVARGDHEDDSPALRNLMDTGLVERVGDVIRITPAGTVALRASEKTRWQKALLFVAAVGAAVTAVAAVVSELSG